MRQVGRRANHGPRRIWTFSKRSWAINIVLGGDRTTWTIERPMKKWLKGVDILVVVRIRERCIRIGERGNLVERERGLVEWQWDIGV